MGHLRDGAWTEDDPIPTDSSGRFVRVETRFRWGEEPFTADQGRYHLYLAHACPWCHRAAIARALKGLETRITVSFVHPILADGGWRFASPDYEDPIHGASFVHELYTRSDPRCTTRVTVPVLWDRREDRIVANESEDLIRLFDQGGRGPELYPESLRPEIDEVNRWVYGAVNNGVYRCGFARTQEAYEEAFAPLFGTLDVLSARLRRQRYLMGDFVTEADIRLFVTLVRFDAVYYSHFKCNRNRIEDDEPLQQYLEHLWTLPAFRDTTRMDEIKLHYYGSHRKLNPTGIVPVGPRLRLTRS